MKNVFKKNICFFASSRIRGIKFGCIIGRADLLKRTLGIGSRKQLIKINRWLRSGCFVGSSVWLLWKNYRVSLYASGKNDYFRLRNRGC